jgi:Rrf2 family protein
MKLITRNTDYAVRAICYMAKKRCGVVSVTELVRELGIPRPFLRKILQALSGSGLVSSRKGVGGGFTLEVSPDRIKLSDIIRIFQGGFSLNECLFKEAPCPNRKVCPLKKRLDAVERRAAAEIGAITIVSLLKGA